MRRSCKALPVLVGAALGACLGAAPVKGDFIVSVQSGPVASVNPTGYSVWVVNVMNNGVNGTGTSILGADVTVTTPGSGTSGALYFDLVTGGSGEEGNPLGTGMTFGGTSSPNLGTFIRIGNPTSQQLIAGQPSIAFVSPDATDPSYEAGTVHSLEVAEAYTSGAGDNASVNSVPFLNVVVPTGTSWSASGRLSSTIGGAEEFSLSEVVPEPVCVAPIALGAVGIFSRRRHRSRRA